MEEESTLRLFNNQLFSVIREAQQIPVSPSQMANAAGKKMSANATQGANQLAAKSGASMNQMNQQQVDINQGFTTYADFRDINEEVIYLFCSYAMSMNFSVDSICSYVLPIG